MKKIFVVAQVIFFCVLGIKIGFNQNQSMPKKEEVILKQSTIPIPQPTEPINIEIETPTSYWSYSQIIDKLKEWNQKIPNLTQLEIYGQTSKGTDLYYFRVGSSTGPKVLLTATIHGNEQLSTMAMMGIISKYLNEHELHKTKDVFFIPVVSPDGYTNNSRHAEGVDPNRNFTNSSGNEHTSVSFIEALKNLHRKEKFDRMISTHNYGRIFLYPWGDPRYGNGSPSKYSEVCGKMAELAGYNHGTIYKHATSPKYGFEADWFYRHGCFGLVAELGLEFRPNVSKIKEEIDRAYLAYLFFVQLDD